MKKNIIFYFSDQQRSDTVTEELTPNLFNLANEGIIFKNHYTCQPVCGPARACLQTGQYATKTGCFRNAIPLPENCKPLAEYFNEDGYQTAYIGKWHLASDTIPGIGKHYETEAIPKEYRGGYQYWRGADVLEFTSHGYGGYIFDESGNKIDFDDYRADAINRFALEFLDSRDTEKPFFMFISQLEPHHQNDRNAVEGYKPTVQNYKKYQIPDDLSFLKGDYEKEFPDYLSAINRLDHNVGELIRKLKEKGLYENTIIIYTSDHGCHFKTRNLEYKRCCHDNTTKTPLIISGAINDKNIVYNGITSLIDLPPTLLSVAGIDIPHDFDGTDIFKQFNVPSFRRDTAFIQISESQCGRAIRYKKWKYSVRAPFPTGYALSSSPVYIEEYLYDLEEDPSEKNNLIKDNNHNKIREELKNILIKEMICAGENKPVILPALISKKK